MGVDFSHRRASKSWKHAASGKAKEREAASKGRA